MQAFSQPLHIMPHKSKASKASKIPAPRKSTRKIQKTARSEQAELELDEEELPPAEQNSFANLTDDDDGFYVNDEEEARIMRREEEEESAEEEEFEAEGGNDEDNSDESDEDEEPVLDLAPVVPQKRKKGKNPKNPTSKIFLTICSCLILANDIQNV